LILDVGSNIGASVAFFRARYPSARIVGLEPDPRAFARLQGNVADLDVMVLQVAAAAEDGLRVFHPAEATWLSSFDADADRGAIEVEARGLDSLLDDLGIERVDLLKIDVEGAEAEILSAFLGLGNVGAIVGELHPDVVADAEGIVRLLGERFDLQVDRRRPTRWRFRGKAR
jgi:FkbM family methyltransferase